MNLLKELQILSRWSALITLYQIMVRWIIPVPCLFIMKLARNAKLISLDGAGVSNLKAGIS